MKHLVSKHLISAFVLSTALASTAYADGIQPYSPTVAYEPFSWTGLYVGVHAGWEQKDIHGVDLFFDPAVDRQTIDGWIGGGQFGYNHQFGRVVLGTELSGSWGNVEGNGNCFPSFPNVTEPGFSETTDCRAKQNWTVQWLNKLGYTFGTDHRLLAYVTGGVAASGLSINRKQKQISGDPGDTVETDFAESGGSTTFVGGVLGGGFQYAFTNSLSLGVEYLHAEYANSNFDTTISRHSNVRP